MSKVTMKQMLEAGVHFGHQKSHWHPKMAPYIFGIRNGVHIINLETTLPMFNDAMAFLTGIAKRKGRVLFVGTKHAAGEIMREEAQRCGMPYVDHRWLGGMLTNYKTVRHSIKRLKTLEKQFESEEFGNITKKEILNLTREKAKLERSLGGIKNMGGLPEALFVIDIQHEQIAIQEALNLQIPIVGVVDTNTEPKNVDYLIPGNDDSTGAIRLYAGTLADMILEAKGSDAASNVTMSSAKKAAPAKKPVKVAAEKPVVEKAEKAEATEAEVVSAEAAPEAVDAKDESDK
jgi:small subunit ribosomal protein S2